MRCRQRFLLLLALSSLNQPLAFTGHSFWGDEAPGGRLLLGKQRYYGRDGAVFGRVLLNGGAEVARFEFEWNLRGCRERATMAI